MFLWPEWPSQNEVKMRKFRKFKHLPPLTATQLQNRKRRRMLRDRMLYGMRQPKGTQPRWGPAGEPAFKPMPAPGFSFDITHLVASLLMLMPWMRRRRKEAELAEQRRSQSIKAKGVSRLVK